MPAAIPASAQPVDYIADHTPQILWQGVSGDATCSFVAPWSGWIKARSTGAAGVVLVSVGGTALNLVKSAFLTGYPVAAGASVALKLIDGVTLGYVDMPVGIEAMFVPRAESISISGFTFDDTQPGTIAIAGAGFDDTPPIGEILLTPIPNGAVLDESGVLLMDEQRKPILSDT